MVLLAVGWFTFGSKYVADQYPNEEAENVDTNETPVPGEEDVDETVVEDEDASGTVPAGEPVITYTDDGFSPSELTVAVGTEVRFVNSSSGNFWPASAIHPTHTVYPGSNISLCGTADALIAFDACGGIAAGGSYSFTFDEVGEWGYHNHLNASEFGRVIVLAD